MEAFKEKLKIQNLSYVVCAVILVVFNALLLLGRIGLIPFFVPALTDHRWSSAWSGFVTGASTSILFFMIFGLLRNRKALRNEQALKKLYVKMNDERSAQVTVMAKSAAFHTFLLLGIIGAIICGYFNMVVSVTVMVCLFCASMLLIGFEAYYKRKY
jgi:multisubunit Na+/H+ antiporter MnhB subunit